MTYTNDEANLAVAGVSGPSGVLTQAQAASLIIAQVNPPLRFVNRVSMGLAVCRQLLCTMLQAAWHRRQAQLCHWEGTLCAPRPVPWLPVHSLHAL